VSEVVGGRAWERLRAKPDRRSAGRGREGLPGGWSPVRGLDPRALGLVQGGRLGDGCSRHAAATAGVEMEEATRLGLASFV
jgi:hypothetical protein